MRSRVFSRAGRLALVLAGAVPASLLAQVGIAARASTLGIGAEVSYRASRNVGFRAGGNWLSFSRDGTIDEIDYEITPRFENGTATLDLFPFGGAFRVSGGVMLNGNEGHLDAVLNQPVRIGGVTYTPQQVGSLIGRVTFRETAPYAGLGFEGSGRVAFLFDLGVAFTGTPRASLIGNSNLTGVEKQVFDANVELEEMRVQAEIDEREYLKYHPILSIGLRFRL